MLQILFLYSTFIVCLVSTTRQQICIVYCLSLNQLLSNHLINYIILVLKERNEVEEFNNMQLRCEILETEQDALLQTIKRLDRDEGIEEKQMESIENQQQKLQNKIEELKKR